MSPAPQRIVVVEEHPVIVSGLRGLIGTQEGWAFAGHAGSCAEALEKLGQAPADLVVLEPGIGGMDGLGRLGEIARRTRVLCFSALNEQLMAERALREGARGYLMKTAGVDEILAAIGTVLTGGIALSVDVRCRLIGRIVGVDGGGLESNLGPLNNRELQVVHLIGANRSSRQIAEHMCVSEKTVATHRLRIREKLSLRSANDLIRIAARWVDQDMLS